MCGTNRPEILRSLTVEPGSFHPALGTHLIYTDKLPSPSGWCTLQVWPLPTVGGERRVVPVWERGGSIPQGPDGASTAGHVPGGSQLFALTPEVGH